MTMQHTKALELGHFIDEVTDSPMTNYQALVRTIDDGVILPSEWVTVDDEGESISVLDAVLGLTKYVSFVEIPEEGGELTGIGSYGLGFTQDFLERQGVDTVQYLVLDEDMSWEHPVDWVADKLEGLYENPELYQMVREHAQTAIQTLREDPEKQAVLRERITERANDTRTYYEVVDVEDVDGAPEEAFLKEWRGTEPVHFTLSDVQTVYVSTTAEVEHFRTMYPQYQGTFVVLR